MAWLALGEGLKFMRRFWVETPAWDGDVLNISGDLFHHLHDVVRFGIGDRFEILSAREAWFVEVIELTSRSLKVRRKEKRPLPEIKPPHVHIALSVPRFTKVDWIVEKAVELGVKGLHLFVSDYSFVRETGKVPQGKMERWQKLTRQAAQQSGRGELMEIAPVSTLDALLSRINQMPGILSLFPYEGECPTTLKGYLQTLKAKEYQEIWTFIGSEGGFSRAEVAKFQEMGIAPVTLGSQVLRVETACVALASILKYEFEALD